MKLTSEQLDELLMYRSLIRRTSEFTTIITGESFDINDYAQMAWLIWRRMGKIVSATGYAWRRMMQSNCPNEDVMALVSYYVFDVLQKKAT